MTNQTATPAVDWAAVQIDYEQHNGVLSEICVRHGVTLAQLRYRREQHNWKPRLDRNLRVAPMINRMLRVLDGQVRQLENNMNTAPKKDSDSGPDPRLDKNATLLGTMTRTLEKLIELDGARRTQNPAAHPRHNKQMSDIRNKLVARIEQLKQQR